jgi:protein involved in polysaccharide export with SLBB domain
MLTAVVVAHAPCSAQSVSDSTMMAPGDVARIVVWKHPEFSGDFPIGADGTITHPLFRSIHAAAVPLAEVENRLRQFLTQYDAQPAFTFTPLLRIFVVGEVRQPNTLTVPPGTTVAEAIAVAGGPTDQADLRGIRLIRGDQTIPLDLTRPDLTMARTTIRSGDQIVVGRGTSFLRDYLGPVAALIAGAAAIANVIIQVNK